MHTFKFVHVLMHFVFLYIMFEKTKEKKLRYMLV